MARKLHPRVLREPPTDVPGGGHARQASRILGQRLPTFRRHRGRCGLDTKSQIARIVEALGLPDADDIPPVNGDTVLRYYSYLREELAFPFTARCPELAPSAGQQRGTCVVQGLLDPEQSGTDDFGGILCDVRLGSRVAHLPLMELQLARDCYNWQLVEDYWYWNWNWRSCR